MKKETREKKRTNEKPVSLYPFTPEEALKKLLQAQQPKKRKGKQKGSTLATR